MATQPVPMPYQPYQAPTATNPIGFNNTNDPRKVAANQRQVVQGQGDALMANDANLANQYAQQAGGVEQYLNPIENTLATGGGGFNQAEQSQINLSPELKNQMLLSPGDKSQIQLSAADRAKIELSPQDKQNIITGAGISAGAGTASSVGAAERAAAAAGGNPAALAAYRARAAQTEGAQAGDAMTQARIGAKKAESEGTATAQGLQSQGAATAQGLQSQGAATAQGAGSSGAQAIGGARMGQQQQGLGYYSGLQSQKAQQSLAEQGLQQGAYGTQTSGTGQAAGLGIEASKQPTTTDKIIGGIGGALSMLADGTSSYLDNGGMDAVVGENGPELIVEHASDPVRSHTRFMADGMSNTDDPGAPALAAPSAPQAPGMTPAPVSGFKRVLNKAMAPKPAPPEAAAAAPQPWTRATPYAQMGAGLGTLGKTLYNHFNKPAPAAPATAAPAQVTAPTPTVAAPQSFSQEADAANPSQAVGAPDSSAFGLAAPDSMMADGGTPDTSNTILNDYLGSAESDALRPAAAAQVQAPQQGQDNTGSSIGKAVGGAAKLAALAFLSDGTSGYRARPAMMADGSPDGSSSTSDSDNNAGDNDSDNDSNDSQPWWKDLVTSAGRGLINEFMPMADGRMATGYRARPAPQMAANGLTGIPDLGLPAPTAPKFNPGKLITSPTRVHLDKGDQVVPLSYRAKAKIRPSAALEASTGHHLTPMLHHTYGGIHA